MLSRGGDTAEIPFFPCAQIPAGRADGAFSQRKFRIAHDQVFIYLEQNSKTRTRRACAERAVEREHSGSQLADGYSAVGAGVAFAHHPFCPVVHIMHEKQPLRELERGFD